MVARNGVKWFEHKMRQMVYDNTMICTISHADCGFVLPFPGEGLDAISHRRLNVGYMYVWIVPSPIA